MYNFGYDGTVYHRSNEASHKRYSENQLGENQLGENVLKSADPNAYL